MKLDRAREHLDELDRAQTAWFSTIDPVDPEHRWDNAGYWILISPNLPKPPARLSLIAADAIQNAQAVAAQLRAERAAREMTIDSLSATSGIPKQTLMRYLKGTRDIPIAAFYAIAEGLGIGADVLLDRAQRRHDEG